MTIQWSSAPDTPDWVVDAVFYQIFPDRFAISARVKKPGDLEPWNDSPTTYGFKGGDLLGIMERLDYIEELGATAIYLNPVFSSASNHRYHTFDYYQIDPLLGGNEAMRALLDAAHARGIKIIFDGVFNHTGRGFWPFHHILENGSQSPYVDWFKIHGYPLHAYNGGNKPNYDAWWGLPALPKLNIDNPPTRQYILDVAEYWIEFGADGWRLDVPTEIDDASFWHSFRQRVRAANSEAYLVGEIWDLAEDWLRGDRFDALMNYPLSFAALGFFAAKTLDHSMQPGGYHVASISAEEALQQIEHINTVYPPSVVRSQYNLLDSHDTPRFITMAGGDSSALHLATLMMMTLPGAPALYYGSEIGLAGGPDPACRGAFNWDRETWDRSTWDLTRRAITTRHNEPALRRGDFQGIYGKDGLLAYLRTTDEDVLLVIFNAESASKELSLSIPTAYQGRGWQDIWSGPSDTLFYKWREAEGNQSLVITMPARACRILKLMP